MKIYLAGPLFTPAERAFLDGLAERLRSQDHECFVPHQQAITQLEPSSVFSIDSAGLREAEVVVAWLDGPMIDDGTACEIGIFSELIRVRPHLHRGVIGLSTDLRSSRRRDAGMGTGGLNLFVAGAILEHGRLVWSIDETETVLREWDA